jgi:transposase
MNLIYERTGVKYHEVDIYRLLHKWGFSPKVPKMRFVNAACLHSAYKQQAYILPTSSNKRINQFTTFLINFAISILVRICWNLPSISSRIVFMQCHGISVYDYTNDKMYTHCYKHKKSNQFIDFINKVDSLFDPSIKQIFIVLDNASIHRSKKTREAMKKRSRIVLVFLPTKAPELDLIEVRWMWMHRMAVNNSIFENESDIGKAVSDWTKNYNKTHSNTTSHILQKILISV